MNEKLILSLDLINCKLGYILASLASFTSLDLSKGINEIHQHIELINKSLKDNKEYEIPTSELKINDTIVVKPGCKVPCDAVIIEGFSALDEQMLTGESLPIDKTVGDNIVGGSINTNGLLYATVTKIGGDTTVSQIIKFAST